LNDEITGIGYSTSAHSKWTSSGKMEQTAAREWWEEKKIGKANGKRHAFRTLCERRFINLVGV